MELSSQYRAHTQSVCTVTCIPLFFMSNISFSQFNVDRANAEEFYEVYKGVVTEYPVSINTTLLCHHSEYLHRSSFSFDNNNTNAAYTLSRG